MGNHGTVGNNGGGMVHDGSVGNNGGGMVDNRGVVDNGSVVEKGSSVGNNSVATVVEDGSVGGGNLRQTLGVVNLADASVASAESLGDLHGSHLTISLGDGLMAGLSSCIVDGGGVVHLGGGGSQGEKGGSTQEGLHIPC